MTGPRRLPTIADVEAAARAVAGIAAATPMIRSTWLSDLTAADVWLKLETLQVTGSFKIRGAVNALEQLRMTKPGVTSVVTASAGNHGQAIAWAARRLGLQARVHLPMSAPVAKYDALVRLGADLVTASSYDAAEEAAHAEAETGTAPYVSPYDDPDVIAGAGTVALEMLAAQPDLDTFVVPLGGGGLLSGTALVARARVSDALVIGTEAAASPVFTAALAAGRPVTVTVAPTIADGLAGNMDPEAITFELVRDLVDRVDCVPEPAIHAALCDLILKDRLVAEGASAVAIAAVAAAGRALEGRRVGVILSGRNVDAAVVRRVLGVSPSSASTA